MFSNHKEFKFDSLQERIQTSITFNSYGNRVYFQEALTAIQLKLLSFVKSLITFRKSIYGVCKFGNHFSILDKKYHSLKLGAQSKDHVIMCSPVAMRFYPCPSALKTEPRPGACWVSSLPLSWARFCYTQLTLFSNVLKLLLSFQF